MTDAANNTAIAQEACEALSHDYGRLADAWDAEGLAALFTEDGVFDRLGTRYEGREAIRHFIANRPREFWARHEGRNFRLQLAADGRSAEGWLDLRLERGRAGETTPFEVINARYHDRFLLTPAGWRFAERKVVMV